MLHTKQARYAFYSNPYNGIMLRICPAIDFENYMSTKKEQLQTKKQGQYTSRIDQIDTFILKKKSF